MKDCRSIIWQAFIQKLALWLYGYWVLGIGYWVTWIYQLYLLYGGYVVDIYLDTNRLDLPVSAG